MIQDDPSSSSLRKEVQDFLRSSEYLLSAASENKIHSDDYHVATTEALLQINDLTEEEIEAVQKMLDRLRQVSSRKDIPGK